MFVHRLTEPIDEFDGLASLSDWLRDGSPQATRWAMQAILALADAAHHVGWRGDMRHMPAVGALPTPPATTAYLVVKQNDNGATFLITAADVPWRSGDIAITARVEPRDIGSWTPPASQDLDPCPPNDIDAPAGAEVPF
jgi:hypothetical protein